VLKKALTGGFLLLMVSAMVIGGFALYNRSVDAHAWQGGGQAERNVASRGVDNQVMPGGQGRGRGSQGAGASDSADQIVAGAQNRGRGGQGGANVQTNQVVPGGQGRGSGGQGGANAQTNQVVPGGQGRGSGGQGTGARDGTDETGSGGGFGRGQGQGNSQSSRIEPQAERADWQTVKGTVVETEELVIETADGQTVQVGLGQSHYRESQGFILQVGDSIRVSGYLEDGEFKAGQVENLDTGASIVLRDSTGRPMWAGQGNRKNAVS
jgi:hypothetical protein